MVPGSASSHVPLEGSAIACKCQAVCAADVSIVDLQKPHVMLYVKHICACVVAFVLHIT